MDTNRLKVLAGLPLILEGQDDKKAGRTKVFKIMSPLQDEIEKATDAVSKIRDKIQSSVLVDLLKSEGFPATESKAAIAAVEAAYQAV